MGRIQVPDAEIEPMPSSSSANNNNTLTAMFAKRKMSVNSTTILGGRLLHKSTKFSRIILKPNLRRTILPLGHEILVSALGPLVLGFGVLGLRVWGQGLTICCFYLS